MVALSSNVAGEDAVQSSASLSEKLAPFARSLSTLVGGLEQRFLPLGAELRELVSNLTRLATVSQEALGAVRDVLTRGSVSDLEARTARRMDVLRAHMSETSKQSHALLRVSDDLEQLRNLCKRLDDIASFLGVCRLNFAVESARTPETQKAFSGFVEDVKAFASNLGGLAQQIEAEASDVLAEVNRAARAMKRDGVELQALVDTLGAVLTSAALDVRALLEGSRKAVDRIEVHRENIKRGAGEVVYYLQFGDIVRQKCEHVLSAVEDAERAGAERGDFAGAGSILAMQSTQLELIEREMLETRDKLDEGYGGLGRELDALVCITRELFERTGAHGSTNSAWAGLKGRLRELQRTQARADELDKHALRIGMLAGKAAVSLHDQVQCVVRLSGRLHFLALNAIVQISHQGHRDPALGALSRQLEELHQECEVVTREVTTVLDRIQSRVLELARPTYDGSRGSEVELIDELEEAERASSSELTRILELSTSAQTEIIEVVRGLAALGDMCSDVRRHRSELGSLLRFFDGVDLNARRRELEAQLAERFTMQTEREAHWRATREGAAADVSLPPRELAVVSQSFDEESLGDNVELF